MSLIKRSKTPRPFYMHLPAELIRLIYDYDDTYRTYFQTIDFQKDLYNHAFAKPLAAIYYLIRELNRENSKWNYVEIEEGVYDSQNIRYEIYTQHYNYEDTNIIEFTLVPPNENNETYYGYICNESEMQMISDELMSMNKKDICHISAELLLYFAPEHEYF